MTEAEKELVIKDLFGRLPYGVKVQIRATNCIDGINTLNLIDLNSFIKDCPRDEDWYDVVTSIKPYFRPMSSMTEEEQKEFVKFHCVNICPIVITEKLTISNEAEMFDWLNKKMFDYRGLIPKGLALEAPDGMYN